MENIDQQEMQLAEQAESMNSASLFGDISAEMPALRIDELAKPAPSDAVSLEPATPTNTDANPATRHDEAGTAYNPLLHEPELKKNGTWKLRRGNGGKKKLAEYYSKLENERKEQQRPEGLQIPDNNGDFDHDRKAKLEAAYHDALLANSYAMAAGGFTIAQLFLDSDEWKPESGELDLLAESIQPVLAEQGWQGWGPKMTLMMTVASIGSKRIHKPKTNTRLSKFWSWTKRKIYGQWHFWRGRKANQATSSDIRNGNTEAS